jgi:hypothetical protein
VLQGDICAPAQLPALTKCTSSAGGSAAEVLQGGLPAPASFAPPAKSLMNLATTVDSLAFSPDQQVARCPVSHVWQGHRSCTHPVTDVGVCFLGCSSIAPCCDFTAPQCLV